MPKPQRQKAERRRKKPEPLVWPMIGLGEALQALRKQRKMTQQDVADAMGTSISTISAYENERTGMLASTLSRYLREVKADVGQLASELGQTATEDQILAVANRLDRKIPDVPESAPSEAATQARPLRARR